ncbi:hypothetical protein [Botryobacter ruber]|uniref:hypothetical protein n=1 Tax=Botryobacter ruber TaxID=2171629 RepID=UPI000E0C617B|nr:hypothetical protein [Botryobacter ruber]
MIRKITIISCIAGLLCLVQISVQGQDSTATTQATSSSTGFLDFNGYYDTREFSVYTLNIFSQLPKRFEYFSLTNFQGDKKTADLDNFYTEQNVRWKPVPKIPIDLTAQWIIRSGTGNDNAFLGILWKPGDMAALAPVFKSINLYYFANLHIVRLSEHTGVKFFRQLEHVYKLNILPKLLDNRVYIGGFADQNVEYHDNGKVSFNWVTEHQLGVMVLKQFYVVVEYRINEFSPTEKSGVGYGLQYVINY